MGEAKPRQCSFDCLFTCICCFVVLPGLIAMVVTLSVLAGTSIEAVYTVTITGVAGLDPAAASAMSPVFNLTVRVDNARDRMPSEACIGRLSTVDVSYEGVVLGRGSVPEFCADNGKVRERGVRAWGQDVALPPFLRDQLAAQLATGEASVDVKVTTPAESFIFGDTVLVCSQAKIGGGPAPCREESVYHQKQADQGSNG